jgi:hypothetical protein
VAGETPTCAAMSGASVAAASGKEISIKKYVVKLSGEEREQLEC